MPQDFDVVVVGGRRRGIDRPAAGQGRGPGASWLLAGGSDLKSVMDRMGHAQITTTQKYLHTLPDADHKNLTALDRIRKPAPGSPPEPAD